MDKKPHMTVEWDREVSSHVTWLLPRSPGPKTTAPSIFTIVTHLFAVRYHGKIRWTQFATTVLRRRGRWIGSEKTVYKDFNKYFDLWRPNVTKDHVLGRSLLHSRYPLARHYQIYPYAIKVIVRWKEVVARQYYRRAKPECTKSSFSNVNSYTQIHTHFHTKRFCLILQGNLVFDDNEFWRWTFWCPTGKTYRLNRERTVWASTSWSVPRTEREAQRLGNAPYKTPHMGPSGNEGRWHGALWYPPDSARSRFWTTGAQLRARWMRPGWIGVSLTVCDISGWLFAKGAI